MIYKTFDKVFSASNISGGTVKNKNMSNQRPSDLTTDATSSIRITQTNY